MTGRLEVNVNKVSEQLRKMGTPYQPYPDAPVGAEDIEDAKYFTLLARKNDTGTLTIEEADEIMELFEGRLT